MIEHVLVLGFVPYGNTIGRVSAGPGTMWVDLPLPDRACLAVVRGASVSLLEGAAPSVAPRTSGGAWLLRGDGSLDLVGADGVGRTVADGAHTGYPEGVSSGGADGDMARAPRLLAAAPDGGAWLITADARLVLRVTAAGEIGGAVAGLREGDVPAWIAPAPDGGAWLAVPAGRAVVRLAPDGSSTRLDAENAHPDLVVADGADGAWFADRVGGVVGHVSATGRRDVTALVEGVVDLALGSDGAPWFVDAGGIGRLRDGAVEHVELPAVGRAPGAMFHPVSIVATDDGSLVFSEYFYGGEGSTAYLGRVRFDGEPPNPPGGIAGGTATGGCAPPAAGAPVPPTTDGSPTPPPVTEVVGSTTTGPP